MVLVLLFICNFSRNFGFWPMVTRFLNFSSSTISFKHCALSLLCFHPVILMVRWKFLSIFSLAALLRVSLLIGTHSRLSLFQELSFVLTLEFCDPVLYKVETVCSSDFPFEPKVISILMASPLTYWKP